jgi:predicted CoA-substrate-specific enzyme activase
VAFSTDRAVGICIGSTTFSHAVVQMDAPADQRLIEASARSHGGDPFGCLAELWTRLAERAEPTRVYVTGRAASRQVPLPYVCESQAVEEALRFLGIDFASHSRVVSAGGEMILAYELDREGRIAGVRGGNKCASGTGEFFLQQIRRMGLSVTEASTLALTGNAIPLSKRCSVFCKSDCTHALNKGRSKADVVAGLCGVIANNIVALLDEGVRQHLVLIGGCARNAGLRRMLEERFPNLHVPAEPDCVEAIGAACHAARHGEPLEIAAHDLKLRQPRRFASLPSLSGAGAKVTFAATAPAEPRPGQECLVGLDVGSTTTKAVLVALDSGEVWGRIYLRTNGNPIQASQECYESLRQQAPPETRVVAVGVTGSGRSIAGLHAQTPCVINEIVAHARAAAHYDPEVDTIFEIGGQDAKYTHLTQGVPSDYAMNEACSAGTGSFLEEAARESFAVAPEEIAERALAATNVPQFNEQCAAFIGSDIKTAVHEGLSADDVLAGLVYSICSNYLNKVKGNRPVGRKVLLQGGVCNNRAVPLAMAALVGKPLVVPPDPGLMGAFGVALEVRDRLQSGLVERQVFDLAELAQRPFTRVRSFTCAGGRERCDYGCPVELVEVRGQQQVFGGLCRRYERARSGAVTRTGSDGVAARQRLMFGEGDPAREASRASVGLNRSFLTHAYLPFYRTFFEELGFDVVLPQKPRPEGQRRMRAALCYPAELAHGLLADLIHRRPDWLFLPHVQAVDTEADVSHKRACVLVQGEPYFLRAAFPRLLRSRRVLSPVLDLSAGLAGALSPLLDLGPRLSRSAGEIRRAFAAALSAQQAYQGAVADLGRGLLRELERQPETHGVVLFGRPYNAFEPLANLGIPRKLANMGISVIPFDALPLDGEPDYPLMYWGMGQRILKAAAFCARHPQLFPVFITNFSCGPDSFLLTQFAKVIGRKPSLTLELDSHTADAGVDTRLEAFLDVVACHRRLGRGQPQAADETHVAAMQCRSRATSALWIGSNGDGADLKAPHVKVLLPQMGELVTAAVGAAFRSQGIQSHALRTPDAETLRLGRANATCKECLPLILTLGTLVEYLEGQRDERELSILFMPTASGPCRFGQYRVFLDGYLREHRVPRTGILSPLDDNLYAEIGTRVMLKTYQGVVCADVMENLGHALDALARDQAGARAEHAACWTAILEAIESGATARLHACLRQVARRLARIPLRVDPRSAKTITLVGEIFVRKEVFSRSQVVERLKERGFIVRVAPVHEYADYSDWVARREPQRGQPARSRTLRQRLSSFVQAHTRRRVQSILSRSGLLPHRDVHVGEAIHAARGLLRPELTGEAILTVGTALSEVLDISCGVLALGPFGCMPTRLAETLLSQGMSLRGKLRAARDPRLRRKFQGLGQLPILFVETDGSALPQITQARLEAFMLQAERVHERMQGQRDASSGGPRRAGDARLSTRAAL